MQLFSNTNIEGFANGNFIPMKDCDPRLGLPKQVKQTFNCPQDYFGGGLGHPNGEVRKFNAGAFLPGDGSGIVTPDFCINRSMVVLLRQRLRQMMQSSLNHIRIWMLLVLL